MSVASSRAATPMPDTSAPDRGSANRSSADRRVAARIWAPCHARPDYRTPLFLRCTTEIRTGFLPRCEGNLFTAVAKDPGQGTTYLDRDTSWANVRDEVDMTPLFCASGQRDLPIMGILLEAGADPNAVAERSYGVSPIHEACRGSERDSGAAVARLADSGANLDAPDKGGVTALHIAARDRNLEAVRVLLARGADPNAERGRSPRRCGGPWRTPVASARRQVRSGDCHHRASARARCRSGTRQPQRQDAPRVDPERDHPEHLALRQSRR